MMLLKKILTKFNGLHFRQEYLCFAKEEHKSPLHVYLVNNNRIIKDITNQHLFVGYNPVIFVLVSIPELTETIRLIFSHKLSSSNEFFSEKDALATLELKLIRKQDASNTVILYYEGVKGNHRFLPQFHQYINKINNRLFNKKEGNVFLHDNLYKQVQIAYAVSRVISLITVGTANLYNLFPTDLHGEINEAYYVISLRLGGKACEQVMTHRRILVSQVHCNAYKTVYALGKNHMQGLRSKNHFPLTGLLSEKFQLPLPEHALSYRELELADSFEHGIHRVLLFKIINKQQLQAGNVTLAHIHNSYASWRYKKSLPGNYLLR